MFICASVSNHGDETFATGCAAVRNRYFKAVEDALLPWALADVRPGRQRAGNRAGLRRQPSGCSSTRPPHYTAVEIDQVMAERPCEIPTVTTRRSFTATAPTPASTGPRNSARWCASRCCTHIPTPALQDQMLAEVFRGACGPSGVFAGKRQRGVGPCFRMLHFRDTCNPVNPQTFPQRLRAAGFSRRACLTAMGADCAGARLRPVDERLRRAGPRRRPSI